MYRICLLQQYRCISSSNCELHSVSFADLLIGPFGASSLVGCIAAISKCCGEGRQRGSCCVLMQQLLLSVDGRRTRQLAAVVAAGEGNRQGACVAAVVALGGCIWGWLLQTGNCCLPNRR